MEQKKKHFNRPFLATIMVMATFWVCVGLFVLTLFCGCATKKELHEHEVRTIVADMMAKQAQQDTHVSQQSEDLDSMVTASVWSAMQEYAAQEHEKETTTETITTWVDSLGREMRQEQRTTQRELSRQEQQRQEQLLQQWQSETERRISSMDSAWSQKLSEVESHLRDSLAAQRDMIKQTDTGKAVSWWTKTWAWLRGVLIGIGIAVILMLTKRFWRGWIKL